MAGPQFIITGLQVRLARAALNWNVLELAAKAEMNKNTVGRFEKDGDTNRSTLTKLRETLEAEGVEFIWQDDKQGVLFAPPQG